jgi:hypothetical protein
LTFISLALINVGVSFAALHDGPKLVDLIEILYQILLPVAIILGLGLVVINGYGILSSEGDPRKVQTAKENLTSAILGLVFVVSALALYRIVVQSFFEVSFP